MPQRPRGTGRTADTAFPTVFPAGGASTCTSSASSCTRCQPNPPGSLASTGRSRGGTGPPGTATDKKPTATCIARSAVCGGLSPAGASYSSSGESITAPPRPSTLQRPSACPHEVTSPSQARGTSKPAAVGYQPGPTLHGIFTVRSAPQDL